jgi:hypothetical protein
VAAAGRYPNGAAAGAGYRSSPNARARAVPQRVHAAAGAGLSQQPQRPGVGDRLGGGPLIRNRALKRPADE